MELAVPLQVVIKIFFGIKKELAWDDRLALSLLLIFFCCDS